MEDDKSLIVDELQNSTGLTSLKQEISLDEIKKEEVRLSKLEEDKARQNVEIVKEADALNYVNNIQLQSIQSIVKRQLVENIINTNIPNQQKAKLSRQIITTGKSEKILEKAEKVGLSKLNSHQVASLKAITSKPYNTLTTADMDSADFLTKSMREDLNKIGRVNISENINKQMDIADMNLSDRIVYEQNKVISAMYSKSNKLPFQLRDI